jgi:hypothetical protein
VHVHEVSGPNDALAGAVRQIPDGSLVLLDGLVASPAPDVLVPESRRLRLVALVHMPLGQAEPDADEGAVLRAVAAVVTTSAWARRVLLDLYELPADSVHVAEPGAEAADLAPGTAAGAALLSVAAVIPGKGTTCCSTRSPGCEPSGGAASASARSSATRLSSRACGARPWTPG